MIGIPACLDVFRLNRGSGRSIGCARSTAIGLAVGLAIGLAAGAVWFAVAQEATPVARDEVPAGEPLRVDVLFEDTLILQDEAAGLQLGDRIILGDHLLADVEGELLCLVTFALPEGTISTQFLNTPPPEKVFAITGGTGTYENDRGHGELVEAGDGTGTLAFFLTD